MTFGPAADRLAIAITFSADLPSLAESAHVYLTAAPRVLPGERLGLGDVVFNPVADQARWQTLAPLFEGPVKERLEQLVLADFGERAKLALSAHREELGDTTRTSGVRILVDAPSSR